MRLVDLAGLAVEPSSGAPLVVLREREEPHRLLPVFVGPSEATSIALVASGQSAPRPLTHDLMATLVDRLDGHIEAAEVTELLDGAFLAQLTVRGPGGEQRIETRPSDAIALAVRVGAPLLVSEAVLDEAGTLPESGEPAPDAGDLAVPDDAAIDAAVSEFREFLDGVDPASFASPEPDSE